MFFQVLITSAHFHTYGKCPRRRIALISMVIYRNPFAESSLSTLAAIKSFPGALWFL